MSGADKDDCPSPPRPATSSVSMASLLALARKNEAKIDDKLAGKDSNSNNNNNKTASSNAKNSNSNSNNNNSNKKKRTFEDTHETSVAPSEEKKPSKKSKKRKKNKNNNDNNNGNNNNTEREEEEVSDNDNNENNDNDTDRDDYPYPVDGDDHCESPLEAYQDIQPLLALYAETLRKSPADLAVYDPYFCEGSMVQRMAALGFANVYNRKEDFYETIRRSAAPAHDVLLTNPPYSANHMERLLQFVVRQNNNRPFCLLVPNYVYTKDYFAKIVTASQRMFFITPKKRYLYTTPKGRRQQKSAKVTSPFPTFWYCGNFSAEVMNKLMQDVREKGNNCAFQVAKNAANIPLEVAPDNDPRKKKIRNNLKRKKNKDKKKSNSATQ